MSRSLYPSIGIADYRKIIAVNVEALNHAVQGPAARSHAHARLLGLDARPAPQRRAAEGHRRHRAQGRPQAVSFPGANPRHGHEWKVWQEVKLPDGKIIIPGVIDSTSNFVEHPELVADRIVQYAQVGRPRERHRRRRLRLRHLRRPRAGRQQDRLDEACRARRRRAAGVAAVVVTLRVILGRVRREGSGVPDHGGAATQNADRTIGPASRQRGAIKVVRIGGMAGRRSIC